MAVRLCHSSCTWMSFKHSAPTRLRLCCRRRANSGPISRCEPVYRSALKRGALSSHRAHACRLPRGQPRCRIAGAGISTNGRWCPRRSAPGFAAASAAIASLRSRSFTIGSAPPNTSASRVGSGLGDHARRSSTNANFRYESPPVQSTIISTSSAIPHQSDRRIGPAWTETAAIPATVDEARFAEIVPPATIPVAWRKVWRAVDRSLRRINRNAVVGRLMIAGQETVAMPMVYNVRPSMRGGGECNGGQR